MQEVLHKQYISTVSTDNDLPGKLNLCNFSPAVRGLFYPPEKYMTLGIPSTSVKTHIKSHYLCAIVPGFCEVSGMGHKVTVCSCHTTIRLTSSEDLFPQHC